MHEMFDTTGCIVDYWDGLKRAGGGKRGGCGWRGYEERRRRERERLINLSTCGCVIQLYLWENTQFIEIREFGWGFLMLTS